jgi:hypothetical protein
MKRRTVVALLLGVAGYLRPRGKTSGERAAEGASCGQFRDAKGSTRSIPRSATGTLLRKQLPRPTLELDLDDFSGLAVKKGSEITQLTCEEIWETLRENPAK